MSLPPPEDVVSPGKKSKAKLPDFEKTLANWIRNQQKKGLPVSDDDLKKRARVFSFSRSDQATVSSTKWLEEFKQKNRLGKYADIPDRSGTLNTDTSPVGSPDSDDSEAPIATAEDLQLSTKDKEEDYFDFDFKSPIPEERDSHPIMSPAPTAAPEHDHEMTDLPMEPSFDEAAKHVNRQRSQTLPHLGDYSNGSPLPAMPILDAKPPLSRAMTTSLAAEIHVDPVMTIKRHKSVPDIHEELNEAHFSSLHPPPMLPASVVSNIGAPAEDDNIKALHAIKQLLQDNPGVADADDYLAIGKLMEKMKLLKSPTPSTISLGRKRHFVTIS